MKPNPIEQLITILRVLTREYEDTDLMVTYDEHTKLLMFDCDKFQISTTVGIAQRCAKELGDNFVGWTKSENGTLTIYYK